MGTLPLDDSAFTKSFQEHSWLTDNTIFHIFNTKRKFFFNSALIEWGVISLRNN